MESTSPSQSGSLFPVSVHDVSVHQPSVLSVLLGGSTSMDVDVDRAELNTYTPLDKTL